MTRLALNHWRTKLVLRDMQGYSLNLIQRNEIVDADHSVLFLSNTKAGSFKIRAQQIAAAKKIGQRAAKHPRLGISQNTI